MTRHPEIDVDPQVRTAWRASFSERTPAALDAAVIAGARRALAEPGRRRAAWLRPLALAASVGLCFAIVLELVSSPDGAPADADARAVHEAAVESRAQKHGDVPRAKAGGAAVPTDPTAGAAHADTIPEGRSAVGRTPVRSCAQAEQLPDEWLACIAALEAAGDTDSAALERQRFDEAFAAPDPVTQ